MAEHRLFSKSRGGRYTLTLGESGECDIAPQLWGLGNSREQHCDHLGPGKKLPKIFWKSLINFNVARVYLSYS